MQPTNSALPRRRWTEGQLWLAAGMMLTMMGAMMIHSAAGECQTFDEASHLAAGASYWTTWDFRLNQEHPPLAKLLAAAPPLMAGAVFETGNKAWETPDQLEAGSQFLYHNRLEPDKVLMLARLPVIACTLLLGVSIFLWTKSKAGPAAALVALGLFALDSNFIAHGHYVTTDVAVTLFIFLSTIAWLRYCESGSWRDLAAASSTLGLAAAAKFSAIILIPIFGAISSCYLLRGRWRPLVTLPVAVLGAVLVVGISYGKHTAEAFMANPRKPVATLRDNHRYVSGLGELIQHNKDGHASYLLGRKRKGGHWAYFPVAFGVKTPVAALLLLPLIWLAFRGRANAWKWAFAFFIVVYMGLSMTSNLNIGHRHILPIYPFLYVLIAVSVVSLKRFRAAAIAIVAFIQIVEVARIHPHHLAYFHSLAGGPAAAPRYLLDSNVDWGQDLKHLRRYLDAQRAQQVYLRYFGMADWSRHGFKEHLALPPVWEPPEIAKVDGWVAISVTDLYEVYWDKPTFTWLLKYEPTARVGYSFYVYDLRKDKARGIP